MKFSKKLSLSLIIIIIIIGTIITYLNYTSSHKIIEIALIKKIDFASVIELRNQMITILAVVTIFTIIIIQIISQKLIKTINDRKNIEKIDSSFRSIFHNASDALLLFFSNSFVDCNQAAVKLLNAKNKQDILISHPSQFSPKNQPDGRNSLEKADEMIAIAYKNGFHRFEWMHKTFSGELLPVEVSLTVINYNNKLMLHTLYRDITESKKTESLFLQSQKMEVVGQLAGGIAHDSNNIITIILGNIDIALAQLEKNNPKNSSLISNLDEIRKSALHASDLNKRLLTLGQKDVTQFYNINFNKIIPIIYSTLQLTLPKDITLKVSPNADLFDIKADKSQIIQLVLNIIDNAVYAIDNKGTITIEINNILLNDKFAIQHKLTSNAPFILLSISDTGSGMDMETVKRVFEPFYTTKPIGKGLGLGLSTVYGIINKLHGIIIVESTLNKGTKFNIYIPATITNDDSNKDIVCNNKEITPAGTTILFIDDDNQILKINSEFLKDAGFNLLAANNASDAQLLASKYRKTIKLLITDIIMPKMNGVELYKVLQDFTPGLNVIYTSGYTDNILEKYGVDENKVVFLQKPYVPQSLLDSIMSVLNSINTDIPSKLNKNDNEINFSNKTLLKHKDIIMPLLNNALSSLSKKTVYPLADKLKNIEGFALLAVDLSENIEHFNIDKLEITLYKLQRCLNNG